jgi:hypothetical protein
MFKGKNLLSIRAGSFSKYVKKVASALFSREELAGSYVIEGPSTSKRKPLDTERLEILKCNNLYIFFKLKLISIVFLAAIYARKNVNDEEKEAFWQEWKDSVNRKCLDTQKTMKAQKKEAALILQIKSLNNRIRDLELIIENLQAPIENGD